MAYTFNQTEPWIPPDNSYLVFQDCELVAEWTFEVFSTTDVPLIATTKLAQDILKNYWEENNISEPAPRDVMQWAAYNVLTIFASALSHTSSHCQPQFCRRLPWEGNPDLAGRGMIATYCVQAFMVTFYLALHLAVRFGWFPHHQPLLKRCVTAMQESTRPFLDASLVFCIAVHVATLFTFGRDLMYEETTSTTAAVISTFVSLYTIFPALTLHSCAAEHLQRKRGRKWVWYLIGASGITVSAEYFSNKSSPGNRIWVEWGKKTLLQDYGEDLNIMFNGEDPENQLKWESFCLTETGAYRANLAFTIPFGLICLCTILGLTFVTNFVKSKWIAESPMLQRIRRHWWNVTAVLGWLAMWALLGCFFWFRGLLNDNAGADNNKDREWTFGQILSVATWAPVIMEFIVIWHKGAEKGLGGLLSDRYMVVPQTTDDDDQEQHPPRDEEETKGGRSGSDSEQQQTLYETRPADMCENVNGGHRYLEVDLGDQRWDPNSGSNH